MNDRPSPLMALVVALTTAGFIASPFFTGEFRGYQADQFPVPQIDPLIQPPGWTFSIWLVIYGWLAVSAAYGLFARLREPDWAAMRPSIAVATAVGATWLPVAMVRTPSVRVLPAAQSAWLAAMAEPAARVAASVAAQRVWVFIGWGPRDPGEQF